MKITPKIQKAINIATKLHCEDGAKRKGIEYPYIVHPFTVAWIVASYTDDEDTICGALLHDTVEDVDNYELENIKKDFGKNVAELVDKVTEVKNGPDGKKLPWMVRKKAYLKRLEIANTGSVLISAADKIHNLNSMLDAYNKIGDKIFDIFSKNGDKFWYYSECLRIARARLDSPIVDELEKIYLKTKGAMET